MDEFDLEIMSLGKSLPPEDDRQDAASPFVSDTNGISTSTASISANGGSLRQRDRVLRASVVTVVTLLTFVSLLLVPPDTRSGVFQLLTGPTATPLPVLPAGSDFFIWEHTVPWGMLLIDGRRGPDVRASSAWLDQQGRRQVAGFHLPRGRHTLDYRAALFPTLHCTVSVPRAAADTCPLDIQNTFEFILEQPGIRVLDLQATVDRLPLGQASALAALTQDTLDAAALAAGQATIASGDHFLGADGSTLVATTQLTAQAHFTLSDSVALDRPDTISHCALLCSTNNLFARSGPDTWTVYAPVALSWRYVKADGQVALAESPAVPPGVRARVAIEVAARWQQNHWQVQLVPSGPRLHDPVICAVGEHYLDVLRISPAQTVVNLRLQWPYQASASGLACLLAGSSTFDAAYNPIGTVALVLYRCGVLLAVNDEAQRIFPHLAHASAHEQALALAVAPPGVTIRP